MKKRKIKHSIKKKVKNHKKKFKTIRKKEIRIPIGIPNFDNLIEGGFEKNSINTIVGGAGSGKSIFSTQFLIEGLKNGEKCLYVTFEEKKSRFYHNMKDFGWDLAEFEKKGLFIFLEYTPAKVKTMLEEGGGEIENIVISNKVSRIVIDSITSFALLFEDELAKREAALSLFNMIREWSCTSVLTLEEDPGEDKKTASKSMEFESDSIILFYYARNKAKRKRYIEILKMRGTKHAREIYQFDIGKKGISIRQDPIPSFKSA
ncbi:MAG: ATPase domain-containing protein [Nanoarchaeota archaeon]|nr:ATPase domain-containing protein [Nanoarchaeota archaeon]